MNKYKKHHKIFKIWDLKHECYIMANGKTTWKSLRWVKERLDSLCRTYHLTPRDIMDFEVHEFETTFQKNHDALSLYEDIVEEKMKQKRAEDDMFNIELKLKEITVRAGVDRMPVYRIVSMYESSSFNEKLMNDLKPHVERYRELQKIVR